MDLLGPMGTFVLRVKSVVTPQALHQRLPATVMLSTPFPLITTGALYRLNVTYLHNPEGWERVEFINRWPKFPFHLLAGKSPLLQISYPDGNSTIFIQALVIYDDRLAIILDLNSLRRMKTVLCPCTKCAGILYVPRLLPSLMESPRGYVEEISEKFDKDCQTDLDVKSSASKQTQTENDDDVLILRPDDDIPEVSLPNSGITTPPPPTSSGDENDCKKKRSGGKESILIKLMHLNEKRLEKEKQAKSRSSSVDSGIIDSIATDGTSPTTNQEEASRYDSPSCSFWPESIVDEETTRTIPASKKPQRTMSETIATLINLRPKRPEVPQKVQSESSQAHPYDVPKPIRNLQEATPINNEPETEPKIIEKKTFEGRKLLCRRCRQGPHHESDCFKKRPPPSEAKKARMAAKLKLKWDERKKN